VTTATELEPRTDPSDRDRIRSGVRFCALVFLGLRLLVFAIGLVSVGPIPSHGAVSVPGWPPPGNGPGWSILFTAWERFDALWFLRIATSGYRAGDGSAAFFPAFPLAIRAVSFVLGGHPFAAGMLVSNLCFLGALIVLFFLTSSELSEDAARRTVLYLAFFPTAYFFLMPYSEALFLLLAVTSYWGARRDRWWLAALAGALAAATRNVGIVLAPTLAVEAVQRSRESGRPAWPGVAAAAAVPLGLLAYLGYWWDRSGDLLAPIHQQASWERSPTWPWTTIARGTEYAFRFVGGDGGGYWMIDWLVVVPILLVSVYALFRLRASASIYLWGGLLIPLTFVFGDRPLMSMPRFVLPLFPAFWALADLTERYRIPRWAVIGVEAAGLGLLGLLTVNWYYIF
jgi:Gpi18-like mannosyltransferase